MSLGFCLLSLVTARWQFYLILSTLIGFGLNAMGGAGHGQIGGELVRSRAWHGPRRGHHGHFSLGVLMPVLSALLVEAVGWRGGFLVFGAFTALLVLPVTLRSDLIARAPGPGPGQG